MTVDQYNKSVDVYSDGLFRFVLKNLRDTDKARDIVQDSYEKLWVKVETVSFEKVKSYLFSTAYHTMIDMLRREKRQSEWDPSIEKELVYNQHYSDLKEVLNHALSLLPEIQRSVIMLRDYEGYSYEEIGEITNLTDSQVKVYIFRARTFMKNYIGQIETVI
ncbi:MAG TPA: RNA polymerase sigma factor [Bacteroidales bacterium]|nr:RNA polymerase sigma factor [Bacteroidales bacterium]